MDWPVVVLLGAYHGLNPGMGWLFAVALGMQSGAGSAVWRALPPIALGHALAVAAILAAALLLRTVIPPAVLQVVVACSLVSVGVYRLWRHRHPVYGGMRVGFADLTAWSFLMASAHGAGFMVLPFAIDLQPHALASAHGHAAHAAAVGTAPGYGVTALALHTLSYLMTTGVVAQVVYRRLGLRLLRTAWLNMDWLWAGALVVTGALVLLV